MPFLVKAGIVWLGIVLLAFFNGGFREVLIVPRLGARWGSLISSLMLSTAVIVVAFLSVQWIAPASLGEVVVAGGLWVALTLAFEFLFGHYVFKNPWEKVLADYDMTAGRAWPIVLVCALFALPLAYVGFKPEHVLPYGISNAIAVVTVLIAYAQPAIARWIIALIFAYASVFNGQLALTRPEEYQGFADLAILPFYREIIEGPFKEHAREFLLMIALGQGITAVSLMIGGKALWIGVAGVCIFLTAIIPLGVGSAFPFSAVVSLAALVVLGSDRASNPRSTT